MIQGAESDGADQISSQGGKRQRFRWPLILVALCALLGVFVYPRLLGSLILRAADHGNAAQVGFLLGIGAKADSFGWYIPNDQTPLMLAASKGSLPTVRLLLYHGANVNTGINEWSSTPLMCAVEGGNVAVVRLLVAKGAQLDSVDGSGDTALTLARADHRPEIVRLLKAAEAAERAKQ